MFGMGFAEMLIIGIIAILFLGPDKLPETMVQIAKFFKNVKSTISTAKESIEEELHVSEIKEQAQGYRQELQQAHQEMARLSALDTLNEEIDEVKKEAKVDFYGNELDTPTSDTQAKDAPEVVTFKKKKKKKEKSNKESQDDTPTKES